MQIKRLNHFEYFALALELS